MPRSSRAPIVPPRLALAALLALAGAAAPVSGLPSKPAWQASELARVAIGGIGFDRLSALEADPEIDWWVELDRQLVVSAPRAVLARLAREHAVESLTMPAGNGPLVFARPGSSPLDDDPALTLLARGGGWALGRLREPAPDGGLAPLPDPDSAPGRRHKPPRSGPRLYRFRPDVVLARAGSNLPTSPVVRESPLVADPTLVDLVDVDRWLAADVQLAGWNRWTRGTEIHSARDWLVQQFALLPRVSVTTQQFVVPSPTTQAWNVLAALPGLGAGDELVVVGGHYDATSESPSSAAPGAEDNASGCAGVLELARIFAYRRPLATLVFACYSGEEQGLWGSEAHAASVVAAGRAGDVDLMLDMDMIGYTGDSDLDCLLETSSTFSSLFAVFQAAAAQFTTLRLVTSTFPCCSDHEPFLDRGMPGLLTIENDYSSYPYYHSTLDLPGNLSPDMAENVLRMNVAVVAEIAGMPVFTGDFEIGDTRFWSLVVP